MLRLPRVLNFINEMENKGRAYTTAFINTHAHIRVQLLSMIDRDKGGTRGRGLWLLDLFSCLCWSCSSTRWTLSVCVCVSLWKYLKATEILTLLCQPFLTMCTFPFATRVSWLAAAAGARKIYLQRPRGCDWLLDICQQPVRGLAVLMHNHGS